MDDAEIERCPPVATVSVPEELQVKSNAIVRFLNVQSTVPFARLKCNTNLNMPPSNWLSNSANSYGLGQFLSHQAGFSSFRMANMFPDCVGGVDVVSDAENIKRLLKLPYSRKSVISMIVHRIENTLLIDEFDVANYLLRQEESEWQWLRSFLLENILKSLSDSEQKLLLHPKTREVFRQKYLTSKFLYHSLQESGEKDLAAEVAAPNDCAPYKVLPLAGPVLPEPTRDEHLPDAQQTNHVFNRNVIWTFEDIRMLIGTDMPIFGGANRPCISLRLRDEAKPINVLTGIDYWLDNLMCNVPEVVMCYHLDGIVQRYELIKTEDLPRLENSEFSPQLIRNVAQNILAFLKANVTKAGHTYWLFKARNDDVVKLYDLTTLCKGTDGATEGDEAPDGLAGTKHRPMDGNGANGGAHSERHRSPGGADGGSPIGDQNPFTVPVAMLLYTVARNMKNSVEGGGSLPASKAGAIRTLLNNCIKLLPKEKYPQIVTSSHYILSDLHIPADTDPGCPKFNSDVDEEDDDEKAFMFGERNSTEPSEHDALDDTVEEEDGSQGREGKFETAIKSIQDTLKEYKGDVGERLGKHNSRPAPLLSDTAERCRIALQHIVDGLQCLQYFDSYEEQKQREQQKEAERRRIIHEETHQNMVQPDSAIPLPYERLRMGEALRQTNPDSPIPMGWKETAGRPDGAEDGDEKLSPGKAKKRSKRNKHSDRQKKPGKLNQPVEGFETPGTGTDPRALLLKGQLGVIKSWNVHLKILLFEKACLVYATMAEQEYGQQNYGTTLRHLYSAIRCQQVVTKYIAFVSSQRGLLLGRAGDCFFQLAKQWDNIGQYMEQFRTEQRLDQLIMEELVKDIGVEVENALPTPTENVEQLMMTSCGCYETAIACATTKDAQDELRRRLGSVRNELGVKYMHWAQEEYQRYWEAHPVDTVDDEPEPSGDGRREEPLYQLLAKKSYDSLQKGVNLFEAVADTTNLAFLLCNMGRFMRFRAHIHLVGERPNNVNVQKKFYHEAFGYYQRALATLGTRKENPELWSLVTWELSTATFNLAKQLQDHNVINPDSKGHGPSTEEIEQEVVEMLQRALKLCDQDNSGPKQVLYSFRAALIHHRIASYYHMSYRKTVDEQRRKTVLQLTKLHYEKAAKTFESLTEPQEFLQIQLERIALQEYQCEQSQATAAKTRHLLVALELCKQALPLIDQLASTSKSQVGDVPSSAADVAGVEELQKLLDLFEKRLQVILRTLTKLSLIAAGKKDTSATVERNAAHYKALFAVALLKRPATTTDDIARESANATNAEYALHLASILRKICDLDRDHEAASR
ncbi:erythroid differentiation-related factor 1 [Anopheles cruzii]|uniref:erythroid differentiation-related factor 1 n=1 Tax=Anopheles cruzii TaxID=68878 RepID=UPI0022EC38D9|nr:erythroid differentiation-related factor 1 [Anopheles cruzii]